MTKFVLALYFGIITVSLLQAQTYGELNISVQTSAAGGNYEPKNILAIWISTEGGQFVKTLLAYADKRKTHLNTWQAVTASAGSEYNTVDAITGATKSNHATRTCKWNGTDHKGIEMPDGKYFVQMELTDKNSTGNTASFQFTKGNSAEQLTPADKPSFSSVTLNWVPESNVSLSSIQADENFVVFPNPGNGIYRVSGNNFKGLEVRSISGKLIKSSKTQKIDISNQENGLYLLYIICDKSTVIKKIIKH